MNNAYYTVETKDETEDLKVQKIDVAKEDVTEKQEMHNQEQEIALIEKKNQTDTERFTEEDANEALCTAQLDGHSKIDVFDLTTESNIVSQLEEEEKALEAENFLQDDTTEDLYNTVSSTILEPLLYPTVIKALKLFESFASIQDKQDMIDIFEKVIAEKQTKNLNNVLPPVRRDILLERIEKSEAKEAKREALEEARKNKQHEKNMELLKIRIRPITVLDIKDSQKSKKMTLVLDPIANGNCEFRCIAHAIYGDENLRMRVKQEMKEWFDLHKHGICKGIHATYSLLNWMLK
ncbi:unnamed protein product [Rhizopus microsporus]